MVLTEDKPQRPQTQRDQERELNQNIERPYNCQIGDKTISDEVRRLGLLEGLNACQMAQRLIRERLDQIRK